jgi:hypothetical protein
MDSSFKIVKGKLKSADSKREWQKYLIGKEMLLCSSISDGWNIIGIEGEPDLNGLCSYAWETEPEHEYDNLSDFQEEVSMGNDGFGLDFDEVEIVNDGISFDENKREWVKHEQ